MFIKLQNNRFSFITHVKFYQCFKNNLIHFRNNWNFSINKVEILINK